MTPTSTPATGIRWNLETLYRGPDDPRLRADLDAALDDARAFAATYRGTIQAGEPAASHVCTALSRLENILERAAKACAYAELLHAADATPPEHGALVAFTQERASEVRRELLFFDLEWLALDDATAQRVVAASDCAGWRHYLESSRRYRPHVLSEAEEKVLEEKANTGSRAFARLFDEILAGLVFEVETGGERRRLNESQVLDLLHDPDRGIRRAASDSLTRGLRANEIPLGFVFNTLVQDHAVEDRLRSYAHPMQSRHLANEIGRETVDALMLACEAQHDTVQRYYRLKRRILQLAEFADYDRYAPIGADTAVVPWERARSVVLDAYGAFSPRMADVAQLFFANRWIDAEVRRGKRGGAFSASTVPSTNPFVLLSYNGRLHDVMTLAHELGHGVHQYLARPRGFLQADTPLTTAETASVFGEMLVFEHLLRSLDDPAQRLALLCGKVEDTIATVFRQIALTRFEERLHQRRRDEGEVSRDDICDLWIAVNAALYGDSVSLTENYRWWWAYISHFVHTPFYCYAYGFGELLVLALYEMYRREGASFVPRYLELLTAGGSEAPAVLLRRVGVDVEDPGFWQLGLDTVGRFVAEVEETAGVDATPR